MTAALGLVLACGQPAEQGAAAAPTQPAGKSSLEAGQLYGTWRITRLNGGPVVGLATDPVHGPHLQLDAATVSGNTGCNRFEATALVHEGRLLVGRLTASERGCGELERQERAVMDLLASGPTVRRLNSKEILLRGVGTTLRLNKVASAPAGHLERRQVMLLAATRWRILGADGYLVGAAVGPRLDSPPDLLFQADRWRLTASCGTAVGTWRQQGTTVALNLDSVPASCGTDPAVTAFAAMARSPVHYVIAHNHNLVMAGNGHFIVGEIDTDFRQEDSASIAGEWRVQAIDGRPPAPSHRAPSVIFGAHGYSVWDGCNRREGIFLTNMGQLFTRDSGTSTLALCPEQASPKVHAVLGAKPRIAPTENGVALVSSAGRLDLTRVSRRTFGGHEKTGLNSGLALDLALRSGPARLLLGNDRRFSVQLPCGRLHGDWRSGHPAAFSFEPPERHAPACPAGEGTAVREVQRFFGGEVQAVIGPNGDQALLVSRDQALTGSVVR